MKSKPIIKKVVRSFKHLSRRRLLIIFVAVALVLVVSCAVVYQNVQAAAALHAAQRFDKRGDYRQAQQQLKSASGMGVLPNITREVHAEQQRVSQERSNQATLRQVQKLLREHQTAAALKLLKTVTGPSVSSASHRDSSQTQQVAALQKALQKQTSSTANDGSSKSSGSSGSGTSGSGTGNGSGGNNSGSGGSTPPPPAAMSAIIVNSFSAGLVSASSSVCSISESVNFSVNGSGSVQVTWQELSTKTSSDIENPTTYSFAAAGSQADTGSGGAGLPGLQPGDSYRISVTITDTANGAVSTTAGPTLVSNCASPPTLMAPNQASFMSSPVIPGTLSVIQSQDPLFSNMCQVNMRQMFSVTGPGSVQVVYMVTSASSIGATLYAPQQSSFTAPGSATDSSYTRLPHLPPNDHYTFTAELNVLGDPGHSASAGPITSGCD